MRKIYILTIFILVLIGIFVFFQKALGQETVGDIKQKEEQQEVGVDEKLISPVIKAVYLTSRAAGQKSKIDYVIKLSKIKDINTVVIDIKDFS